MTDKINHENASPDCQKQQLGERIGETTATLAKSWRQMEEEMVSRNDDCVCVCELSTILYFVEELNDWNRNAKKIPAKGKRKTWKQKMKQKKKKKKRSQTEGWTSKVGGKMAELELLI